jgi:hypothetical protein
MKLGRLLRRRISPLLIRANCKTDTTDWLLIMSQTFERILGYNGSIVPLSEGLGWI